MNKNVLLFNFGDWKDSPNNNFINMTDKELDKMMLNSNFKYYDYHEFHELKQKCTNNKNFTIFPTNICSLAANSDKLELLASNLNHDFDVIALSETWTSDNKNLYFEVPYVEGYQLLHGVKGKTLKSSCGFYLKSGIKFKLRKDLDISYFDENNEFQSCWIEILF